MSAAPAAVRRAAPFSPAVLASRVKELFGERDV